MTDINLEHTHKRLMAALHGIADGKGLSDSVPVAYGQTTKIFEALKDAGKHLSEPFHEDDLEIVDRAFKKLGLVRTSDQKNDVANALLKALIG
jgi:hypothetical protein